MSLQIILAILTFAPLLLYLALAIIAFTKPFTKQAIQEGVGHWLALYLVVSTLWELGRGFNQMGWVPSDLSALLSQLNLYSLLLLAIQFLYLTRAFLRFEQRNYYWGGLGIVCLITLLVLDLNPFNWSDEWRGFGRIFPRVELANGVLIFGWGLFMGITAVFIYQSLSKFRHQPLHRNRNQYWIIVWGLTILGDVITFGGQPNIGSIVRLVATLLATYAMRVVGLFDIRRIARRTMIYSITFTITALLCIVGISIATSMWQFMPGINPLFLAVALALVLAFSFAPLLTAVRRFVIWLTSDVTYNASQILHDYGSRITNIVDINQLETIALSFVSEVLEINHATFYLVDEAEQAHGLKVYQLYSVHGMSDEKLVMGTFDAGSEVTRFLTEEHRPLAHFDIDLSPRFRTISEDERAWLDSLGLEVYVPISLKGRWVGLLGLGPKQSGDRYFENDLLLFATLADQTAVALENARLFSDLVTVNHQLQDAYRALENANHQLEESDKLKSAFIGVITHEMRSPFANIIFSLQLLERYGYDNLTDEQREEIAQVAKGVEKAKGMVDNLVTFAGFLNRQGQLRLEEADFVEILHGTVAALRPLVENKGLELVVEETAVSLPVYGDQERLGDAIHHLLHNAIKFTEEGSINIRIWEKNDETHFEILDTGIGIPADRLPILWEGFSQMADPLTRGVEGLGLGLALVKQIVEAHQGTVSAKSIEGQGAMFAFSVPSDSMDSPAAADVWSLERLADF